MRPQMHNRRPPARHRNAIRFNRLRAEPVASLIADPDPLNLTLALDLLDAAPDLHSNPGRLRSLRQRPCGFSPRIQYSGHLQPGFLQSQSRAIPIVVVGHNNRALTRSHSEIHNVIPNRACQHYARQVVPGKRQWPLNSARGGDDLACTNAPQPMPRPRWIRRMVRDPFIRQRIAVVVHTGPHGAKTQAHVVHRFKLRNQPGNHVV